MDNTLYVGMSHQMALRRQMDLIANNIANMNTTGYKRENVIFQEYLEKLPSDEAPATRNVNFVLDYGVARDDQQGEFEPTGNPLDLAIAGKGFFAVQTPNGDRLFTRNGHFAISPDGFLATRDGNKVLGAGDQPIPLPATETDFIIRDDGTVSSNLGLKGRVQVVQFDDEQALTKAGDSYFKGEGGTPAPASRTQLKPGMVESSNVRPVMELTEMVRVLRTYQATSSMLDRFDDLERKSIERLGRVN